MEAKWKMEKKIRNISNMHKVTKREGKCKSVPKKDRVRDRGKRELMNM